MIIIEILFAIVLLVSMFFTLQLLLGLRSKPEHIDSVFYADRCVILIPAHNEGSGLINTLLSAKSEMKEGDMVLVVADNCTDNTAQISRENGVICIERHNTNNIGKGHALQFGIDYIKDMSKVFHTVVVMDADCIFAPNSLHKLLYTAQTEDCVAQALYLMKSPNRQNIRLNTNEFAWIIKNWIRPLGRKKLGISGHLQGSGMAFPMHFFSKYSLASSSIVEDLELGLNIVKGGDKVVFTQQAVVISQFPENEEGLDIQRKRWEHGHLSIVTKMPKTILSGLVKLNFRLVFQAIDAAIPPAIMWILFVVLMGVITIIYGVFYTFSWAIAYLTSITFLILSLVCCWLYYGRSVLTFTQLKGIVPFVLSKFTIYKSFVSNREKTWIRTKRDDK
jgi:cellulose synthase/poly-beta-1,6-N-acetylglucosamine synthase-like glycosyltransferase